MEPNSVNKREKPLINNKKLRDIFTIPIFLISIILSTAFSLCVFKILTPENVCITDNLVISDNVLLLSDLNETITNPTEIIEEVVVSASVTNQVTKTAFPTRTPTITQITFTPTITSTPIITEGPPNVVAFYSDPQSDSDGEDNYHRQIVTNILAKGANPIFNAGDLMEDGTQASLDRFNSVTENLRSSRRFYSALGNNDRKIGDSRTPSQLFLDNFNFPNNERWYSVNWGNLHMVILDSAFAASNLSQRSWLTADLQSDESQSRITGVMFHHPTFASNIQQLLIDHNVDFVIMGHNHAYQHYSSNGIEYFVMGGQPNIGYFIAQIYSERVTLVAYNQNNQVISTINFNNR